MPAQHSAERQVPTTDLETLTTVAVDDFVRVKGLQSGAPRTWGGTITEINRDEFGLYFTLREPIEDGILWQCHASTTINRITVVTDPNEQASIIKNGNFLPKQRPTPRIGGFKGQRHNGFPHGSDWTGHRIGQYSGRYRWGDCLHDDGDGYLWVMFDGDPTLYTATPGEVFICEHESPCGLTSPGP